MLQPFCDYKRVIGLKEGKDEVRAQAGSGSSLGFRVLDLKDQLTTFTIGRYLFEKENKKGRGEC